MSKQRKLQSEIDQTLRKISDGVDEWDALFEKFEETEVRVGSAVHWELTNWQLLAEQRGAPGCCMHCSCASAAASCVHMTVLQCNGPSMVAAGWRPARQDCGRAEGAASTQGCVAFSP